jgi:hypothetical protein
MDFSQREMTEDEPDAMPELPKQDTERVIRLRARRTLEVAVLDQLDPRRDRAEGVIDEGDRRAGDPDQRSVAQTAAPGAGKRAGDPLPRSMVSRHG